MNFLDTALTEIYSMQILEKKEIVKYDWIVGFYSDASDR